MLLQVVQVERILWGGSAEVLRLCMGSMVPEGQEPLLYMNVNTPYADC
jgi:hypothetical protein